MTSTIRRGTNAHRLALSDADVGLVESYNLASHFAGEPCWQDAANAALIHMDLHKIASKGAKLTQTTRRGREVYVLHVHSNLWYEWPTKAQQIKDSTAAFQAKQYTPMPMTLALVSNLVSYCKSNDGFIRDIVHEDNVWTVTTGTLTGPDEVFVLDRSGHAATIPEN